MKFSEFKPFDHQENISKLQEVIFLTLTWSFPSSPIQFAMALSHQTRLYLISTANDMMEPALPGNCSEIKSLTPLNSKRKSIKVYNNLATLESQRRCHASL
ncbi:hypothetical protein AMTR_s00098p00160650 [Amborella trichopoda]|uniref:Uncharacterized protein n=1 Tax=Amborella trichopoda TaxID=13333 RepID=W1NW75_AMBTC|nr:hypothetical protein AMTR_s00098p00160650 [Amborella trichopoda]